MVNLGTLTEDDYRAAHRAYARDKRIAVKPDDVQHGDRVRVVIEGKVFRHPGDEVTDVFDVAGSINMDTWVAEVYLIERPDPDHEVVDRIARALLDYDTEGEASWVEETHAATYRGEARAALAAYRAYEAEVRNA